MKPPPFELARPDTLDEALALLAGGNGEAKPMAGGQSLVPLLNLRLSAPTLLVDLNGVHNLAGIRLEGDRLLIGAMTRQKHLLTDALVAQHAPLLGRAAPYIGHVQTRSRGTVGGSLAHADPAAELPLVMVALDAEMVLRSTRGTRHVPARQFFDDILTTMLQDDELLVEIAVPAAPKGTRCAFREFNRRHGDFAMVAAAAQFSLRRHLTAAVGGVGTAPHYCGGLVESIQAPGFEDHRLEELVDAEMSEIAPLADLHASAEYRRHLATVLLGDCLREVIS
jgi:CO/xanthine dehydrogenase FAD-binding subunit